MRQRLGSCVVPLSNASTTGRLCRVYFCPRTPWWWHNLRRGSVLVQTRFLSIRARSWSQIKRIVWIDCELKVQVNALMMRLLNGDLGTKIIWGWRRKLRDVKTFGPAAYVSDGSGFKLASWDRDWAAIGTCRLTMSIGNSWGKRAIAMALELKNEHSTTRKLFRWLCLNNSLDRESACSSRVWLSVSESRQPDKCKGTTCWGHKKDKDIQAVYIEYQDNRDFVCPISWMQLLIGGSPFTKWLLPPSPHEKNPEATHIQALTISFSAKYQELSTPAAVAHAPSFTSTNQSISARRIVWARLPASQITRDNSRIEFSMTR